MCTEFLWRVTNKTVYDIFLAVEAYFVAKDSNLVTDCIKHFEETGGGERCMIFKYVYDKVSQDNVLEFLIQDEIFIWA